MGIIIKKTITIKDENDWFRVAPPKGKEKQWKDGYSAKEFAKFVSYGDFKGLVQSVLNEISIKTRADFIGEPEVETKLPQRGEGRNHDLLLYNKDIVIGIEAKVNEPFGDNSIHEEYNNPKTSNNKKERIEKLLEMIVPQKSIEDIEIKNLQYQLFTATAGTLLEAYDKGNDKCVFLVLSFHEKEHEANPDNKEAFKKFVNVVCDEWQNSQDFRVKRDGDTEGKHITCWFIERDITFTPQTFKID